MFIVKRLGRNGMWNAVSLIDENGSFRGEAKFDTREQAEDYLLIYLKRMKSRVRSSVSDELQVRVFDDSDQVLTPVQTPVERKVSKKPKKKKKKKTRK